MPPGRGARRVVLEVALDGTGLDRRDADLVAHFLTQPFGDRADRELCARIDRAAWREDLGAGDRAQVDDVPARLGKEAGKCRRDAMRLVGTSPGCSARCRVSGDRTMRLRSVRAPNRTGVERDLCRLTSLIP